MPPIPELEEIRRKQILDAALYTISTHGYAKATMGDIAEAANLSKGGLAHYFKSKDDLFKSAFTEFFGRIFARVRLEAEAISGPLEQLLGFEQLFNISDPDVELGYPLLFDCMSVAGRDPMYMSIFDQWVDNWVVMLSGIIELGMEEGVFSELDPMPMARAISAIYQGIATRWFLARESHSREWALDTYRRAIMGLMAPYMIGPEE